MCPAGLQNNSSYVVFPAMAGKEYKPDQFSVVTEAERH